MAGRCTICGRCRRWGWRMRGTGRGVVAKMKAMPTQDDAFGPGTIRADGRALFPAYLFKAKAPSAIKSQWDLLELVATTPASEAWRPVAEGGCPLMKS